MFVSKCVLYCWYKVSIQLPLSIHIQGAPREMCTTSGECTLCQRTLIKHKTPISKFHGYGDNGQRKVSCSSCPMYCSCSTDALSHPAHVAGLDQNAQTAKLNRYFNTDGFHTSCTVIGTLSTTTA
jgi:hypothetical protein